MITLRTTFSHCHRRLLLLSLRIHNAQHDTIKAHECHRRQGRIQDLGLGEVNQAPKEMGMEKGNGKGVPFPLEEGSGECPRARNFFIFFGLEMRNFSAFSGPSEC